METTTLNSGDFAPQFCLTATGGADIALPDPAGKQTVLFFYPRDNTPGCTNEARDFTALLGDFERANTSVFGISADSLRKHENFIAKAELGLRLISDPEMLACKAYGVWAEKKMYGKSFWGIIRTTFLIGANGRFLRIWPKVKVPGHAAQVLAQVQNPQQ
ncbi:MAG: peroxiredoxin [Rhodobacteraceae bacterium]|nr:peroxiredoxin [Paracoccaceae bacterium]